MTMYITPDEPILAPYITHNSSINPFDEDFKPYVKYDDEEQIYVPYNYDETMAQAPVKFDEIEAIPDIGDLAKIIGVTAYGVDIVFTPAEMIGYILDQTQLSVTVTEDNLIEPPTTVDIGTATAYKAMITDRATYLKDVDYTQSGTNVTWVTEGQIFYLTQKLLFIR